MILIDSNIFIIDRFFKQDDNYPVNKKLIDSLRLSDACTSVYNLFEICGIASFNLSQKEWNKWFHRFYEVYGVKILYPMDLEQKTRDFFENWTEELYRLMPKRMGFIDATILSLAEKYSVSHIITWNKRHFEGRTGITILNPKEFLDEWQPGN